MFILESKSYNRKKRGKSHVGRWILCFLALLVTFSPPLLRTQIVSSAPQIGMGSDLLLTTFIPQVHQQICQVSSHNEIGVGGIEVEKPSFEIMLYTVQEGDTLGEIAQRRGLNLDTIISANQSIRNISSLRVGQRLRIPNQKGVFHKVKKGQTISNISSAYKISVEKILEANDISKPKDLLAGKEIFIPGARLLPSAKEYLVGGIGFIRPVSNGWFSSGYGYRRDPFNGKIRFHTGIDIGCYQGTPIRASKSGKVSFSGWISGYGNTVIIKHTGGYSTKYAHNMRNLVAKGTYVRQGQVIALVGNTGRSIGSHLHFEICKNGCPVNPASFISIPSHR
ncbi:MAG: peptidoglycan DD-metalloendopeptidase family protein [bacterium]